MELGGRGGDESVSKVSPGLQERVNDQIVQSGNRDPIEFSVDIYLLVTPLRECSSRERGQPKSTRLISLSLFSSNTKYCLYYPRSYDFANETRRQNIIYHFRKIPFRKPPHITSLPVFEAVLLQHSMNMITTTSSSSINRRKL
jgi:hypothetical protein